MNTKLNKRTFAVVGAAIGFFSLALAQTPPQQVQTEAPAASIIVKPAADVPASCGSFSGEWTGSWSQGGIGQQWLWVAAVDANCMAKYAYLSHSRPPERFRTAEIKNGALSVSCGGGGACIFERHGDSLWARYSGSQGTNSAVFEKIQ